MANSSELLYPSSPFITFFAINDPAGGRFGRLVAVECPRHEVWMENMALAALMLELHRDLLRSVALTDPLAILCRGSVGAGAAVDLLRHLGL